MTLAHRTHQQARGPEEIHRRPADEPRIDQHHDARESDEERRAQADGQPLRAQEKDFRQRHERGDGGQDHGRRAGGYALLGPEENPVVDHENEERHECRGRPFAPAR